MYRVMKMARRAIAFLLLASALGAALGCQKHNVPRQAANQNQNQDQDTGKRHTGMAQTLLLTEADQGGPHAASVGQDVTLRLDENPTTGYRWALDVDPAGAVNVGESDYAPGGSAPGAAGKREFHLRTKAPGAVHLRLKLWREWQGEGSAVRRCEFVLQVGE